MLKSRISSIKISEIRILNPRVRNKIVAEGIRHNICSVGLKKPISVRPVDEENGYKYELICGQGRLEAYLAAGEEYIPAVIRNVSKEDALLMSLAENIARRNNNGLELLQGIKYLHSLGYSANDIAIKTDLKRAYILNILKLIENGEEYLVSAVENNRIPLYIAIKIATENSEEVKIELAKSFENGKIKKQDLENIKKIIDRREKRGKKFYLKPEVKKNISIEKLIEDYNNSINEKKKLLHQSEHIKNCLMYVSAELKKLIQDEHFTDRLKASGITDIPKCIISAMGEDFNAN